VRHRIATWSAALLLAIGGPAAQAGELAPAPHDEERPAGQQRSADPIEPLFVHPFTAVETGRNDGNPLWSRSGALISFERSVGDKKELHVHLADGRPVQTVYHLMSAAEGEMKFFFPGVVEDISYNSGYTWSPDDMSFVLMSNGGTGNYDLYRGDLGAASPVRLTEHKDKDGQADWAPAGNAVVFVSGRTGKGDVYVLDLATRGLTRLTDDGRENLYPQWSPDGNRIAFMSGSSENHDIIVLEDLRKQVRTRRKLTSWTHDDIRPVWSPDGRKIAFYANVDAGGDTRVWSILVVNADGYDASEGEGLTAKVVAHDVITDVERGPAWTPDSTRIVYVKNDRQEYHPIYVVNVQNKINRLFRTDTKMNHDIACGPDGMVAFRAQVDQWDQIFIAKMKE
jgi:Tol biopolymer transport system component